MEREFHSDLDILMAFAEGNAQATQLLYKQYAPIITKWIITNGGDEDQAKDIIQDAMIVLYQKAKDITFCLSCAIGTYLFAICKRLWYKKFQKKQYLLEQQTDFQDEQNNLEENTANEEKDITAFLEQEKNYELLNKALDTLGAPCSEMLKFFYIHKLSMNEIAEKMGYANTETTKVQKYKCLNRLKKIYTKLSDT